MDLYGEFIDGVITCSELKALPVHSGAIGGDYFSFDADFEKFCSDWAYKIAPQAAKETEEVFSVENFARAFARIMTKPEMTERDLTAVFTVMISAGIGLQVEKIAVIESLEKMFFGIMKGGFSSAGPLASFGSVSLSSILDMTIGEPSGEKCLACEDLDCPLSGASRRRDS